ncbi:Uncharacterized protein K02A2.6 [Stylophora pistillata]|uniref:Uncharacterized protein K02A2.6 n=1 Tax=Stylophora pistillata TaxID=50429 RepID=A0A2B4T2K4_STYPI|nr:Uncharacterized protein K02A2.6 [Stylophora pistillata]
MFKSHTYLITMDQYSDFIEVDEVENTLASTIVTKSEAHFARHGVHETILTDNGPQFIATELEALCGKYQIQHITSSPYWPKGNGKAEAAVKIVKRILKNSGSRHLQEALLTYRNTPQAGHIKSPTQRNTGRCIRGLLPVSQALLLSNDNTAASVQDTIAAKRAKAKEHYDTKANSNLPPFGIGDFVYAKPGPYHKSGPWLYGLVTAIPAPRSYIIETLTGLTRRNRCHLPPAAPPPPEALIPLSWMKQLSAKTPPTIMVYEPSKQPKPVPPPSSSEGPSLSITTNSTQKTPAKAVPTPLAASPQKALPSEATPPSPMELNSTGIATQPSNGSHIQSSPKEGTLTKTRSGRVSKPVIRLHMDLDIYSLNRTRYIACTRDTPEGAR